MEFKVIKRNGNAVVPDGMFKLCGMENAKLIFILVRQSRCERDRHESHQGIHGGQLVFRGTCEAL